MRGDSGILTQIYSGLLRGIHLVSQRLWTICHYDRRDCHLISADLIFVCWVAEDFSAIHNLDNDWILILMTSSLIEDGHLLTLPTPDLTQLSGLGDCCGDSESWWFY